ncbi:MAG TPA: polyprenyl synthetase family protein [Spirochaetia bacterium]|nr:polyprenyl synthetase family protein [Spirochaetia bacterium]
MENLLRGLFACVREDLEAVERELERVVRLPDPSLTETSRHLLTAGGKRMRPAFCLLAARFTPCALERVVPLAASLELIHMASLVHDDVVDEALIRRGQPTVRARWGNRISTHMGDYLFAQSLVLISTYGEPLVQRVLADTSVKMCQGEIHQIAGAFDVDQDLKDYLGRINRKTALLIAASCQLGGVVSGAPPQVWRRLLCFGRYLGMAFQVVDDILDFVADQNELGKPVGSDLAQGILTLPAIRALDHSPARERLRTLLQRRLAGEGDLQEAVDLILVCGAIEYSFAIAARYVAKAKEHLALLPGCEAKAVLDRIADFVTVRRF